MQNNCLNRISQNKKEFLRKKLITGARNYKHYLVNKVFYIICDDYCIYKVIFPQKKFKHLTGIQSSRTDRQFFLDCCSGILDFSAINSQQKYNWQTLKKKAEKIENIERMLYTGVKDSLFLINLHTNTMDFPIAINNLAENLCIGFKGTMYSSSTLRTSSNSNQSDDAKKILAIFAKKTSDVKCSEIVYVSDIKGLTEHIKNLNKFLSDDIIEKIAYIV